MNLSNPRLYKTLLESISTLQQDQIFSKAHTFNNAGNMHNKKTKSLTLQAIAAPISMLDSMTN
jgi:hypothetical protein